jgi:hypothetical protein
MTWSVENIDGHLPRYIWESFATHYIPAGIMLGTLVVSLSYSVLHKVCMAQSKIYREELSRDQQLVVLQHIVEAILLSVIYAPYTYVVLSINFEEQPIELLADKFEAMAIFMITLITMYLIELALRFANLRPLVLAHHLCAFFNAILTTFLLDSANIKAASLLTYFITYEALTFAGLVMYRLAPTHKYTRPTILLGMAVFGLSRPIQCLWIIAALWASWENVIAWQAVLQLCLTLVFTSFQLYSLTIHFKLARRAQERRNVFLYGRIAVATDDDEFIDFVSGDSSTTSSMFVPCSTAGERKLVKGYIKTQQEEDESDRHSHSDTSYDV